MATSHPTPDRVSSGSDDVIHLTPGVVPARVRRVAGGSDAGDAAALVRHDRGSAALLVLIVATALVGASVVALVAAAPGLVDANRARTAADAAALAGAVDGRRAAETVAAANSGALVSWSEQAGGHPDTRTVTVEVQVGSATARARATTEP